MISSPLTTASGRVSVALVPWSVKATVRGLRDGERLARAARR